MTFSHKYRPICLSSWGCHIKSILKIYRQFSYKIVDSAYTFWRGYPSPFFGLAAVFSQLLMHKEVCGTRFHQTAACVI